MGLPFEKLAESAFSLLEKVVPDTDKRRELAHEIATMAEKNQHEIDLAQIKVNEVEAASASLFVSGWRPAAGWVCVVGLGYHFVLYPFLQFFVALMGYDITALPELNTWELISLLTGMLGLGAVRGYEKARGVART